MSLIDDLISETSGLTPNGSAFVRINYKYLLDKAKGTILHSKLIKREKAIGETEMRTRKTIALQKDGTKPRLSQIVAMPGFWSFAIIGSSIELKGNDAGKKSLIESLLMFDEHKSNTPIFPQFDRFLPSSTFPYLTKEFESKHLGEDISKMRLISELRFTANDELDVNTMMTTCDFHKFCAEVKDLDPLLRGLLASINSKEATFRARNKRVKDIVVQSRDKYALYQCKRESGKEAGLSKKTTSLPPAANGLEYIYFGISTESTIASILCGHYVSKRTLFDDVPACTKLKAGWKHAKFDGFKVDSYFTSNKPEIYVRTSTFD